ncbi:hypothetical protein DV737_g4815, partial [Chaetothyriales sp. CBS 132003]
MEHSALWLHGLAGYGKTVMTSFVIQNLVDCLDLARVAIAYYYFDASDSNSLSLRTFLASIVRQYCARMPSLPDRIVTEFDAQEAKYGSSRQLGVEELASILGDLLPAQPSNIIVVDGMDESPEQEAVCELLNMLAEAGDLVHIFASSRPEAAIRRQLTQFTEIELTDKALEGDIGRECLERLDPAASMFAIPELHCHTLMAITCLKYLLMDDFESGMVGSFNELIELLQRFPLLSYAADQACYHIRKSKCEGELQPLILQLFSKEPNPKFMLWLQVVLCGKPSRGVFQIPGFHHIKPQPLYYASSYGLVETVKSLVQAGADLNRAKKHQGAENEVFDEVG